MRKVFLFLILAVTSFTTSTCKKIAKAPFDMYGLWVTNEGNCDHYYVDIQKNGKAEYGTPSYYHGCDYRHWGGKARFTADHLYIGRVGLRYLENPSAYNGSDSIQWGYKVTFGYYKILATMKVKTSFFHHNDTYTFKKIIQY
jgi:hypothetical protein